MTVTEAAPVADPPHDGYDAARRTYARWARRGNYGAIVTFLALLLTNGVNLLSGSWTSGFYSGQMHALLHGRWDVGKDVLGFEGFQHSGKWFMYYGPFPSLLRLPVVVFAPQYETKMTQLSMLGAFCVGLWAANRIGWRVRCAVRGVTEVSRREGRFVALTMWVVGAGSTLTFLASQAWVYHEAEIWGAALAIAAFDQVIAIAQEPTRRHFLLASGLATACILSRVSVGLGPVAALGIVGLAYLVPLIGRWFGLEGGRSRRRDAVSALVASIVPVCIYAYTNYAKFGSLFVFPTSAQMMSQLSPQRRYFLSRSGGTYFGMKFVPTTVLQYFRPDAIRVQSLVPVLDFPRRSTVVGDVTFDAFEPTSSIPASMPALTLLSVLAWWRTWVRRSVPAATKALRPVLIGGVIGALSVLPFGYIAQRYLSDFVPLLVVSGLIGAQYLWQWYEPRPHGDRRARFVRIGVVVVCVMSVVVNLALGVSYHWTANWVPEQNSAPFIAAALRIHDKVPGGIAPDVRRMSSLPYPPSERGTVAVIDDCKGVYWSPGDVPSLAWAPWQAVARTRAAGRYVLRATFDEVKKRTVSPLVVRGEDGTLQTMAVVLYPGHRITFAFHSQGHDDVPHGPRTDGYFIGTLGHRYVPGREYEVEVVMDPFNGQANVLVDGKIYLRWFQFEMTTEQAHSYIFPTDTVVIGKPVPGSPATTPVPGTIKEIAQAPPSVCSVVRDAPLASAAPR